MDLQMHIGMPKRIPLERGRDVDREFPQKGKDLDAYNDRPRDGEIGMLIRISLEREGCLSEFP